MARRVTKRRILALMHQDLVPPDDLSGVSPEEFELYKSEHDVVMTLRGLGHEGKVKSPTYTLIEPYVVSSLNLYHFDFYRFTSPDEYLDAGLDEYFAGEGVCIVEWPDKASPHLPSPDVEIVLQAGGSGRDVAISANTEAGRTCVIGLVKALRGADPAPGTT